MVKNLPIKRYLNGLNISEELATGSLKVKDVFQFVNRLVKVCVIFYLRNRNPNI